MCGKLLTRPWWSAGLSFGVATTSREDSGGSFLHQVNGEMETLNRKVSLTFSSLEAPPQCLLHQSSHSLPTEILVWA